jgi:hypothetical protein
MRATTALDLRDRASRRARRAAAAPRLDDTHDGDESHALDELASALDRPATFSSDVIIANRYRLLRCLGRGGMGEVYAVEDLELGTQVALKTLNDELARDPRMLARLKREVQLARLVTHPNVCRIFDLGIDRSDPGAGAPLAFITMELLAGETLRQRLVRVGPMATPEALPIVNQIADALAAAHASGVIHRDLKSDNVILVDAPKGVRAVVTDFGLARALSDAESSRSASGPLVGTAAYMAPEQVAGEPLTTAVDVYALGVVMFELVTGELPFAAGSPVATALARLHGPAPSPRIHVPDLDGEWEAVIGKCLERQPDRRFASVAEVARALARRASSDRGMTREASAAGQPPRVKGLAFIEVLRWYQKTHGRARLREAIDALPPHLRSFITDPERDTLGLLAGSWYPAALITGFFQHMIRDLPAASLRQLAAGAVQASVGRTLSGVYGKVIRKLITPAMIADHYQRLWRLYHTSGECRVLTHGPTHHELRISDWPAHDSFVCLMNGYATRLILEQIGCKGVAVSWDKCVDRNDGYCAYSQHWIA